MTQSRPCSAPGCMYQGQRWRKAQGLAVTCPLNAVASCEAQRDAQGAQEDPAALLPLLLRPTSRPSSAHPCQPALVPPTFPLLRLSMALGMGQCLRPTASATLLSQCSVSHLPPP